jgi:hypothetical protein
MRGDNPGVTRAKSFVFGVDRGRGRVQRHRSRRSHVIAVIARDREPQNL